jgi:hypothetical protein
VLLDINPPWTWLPERRDSPWYPSATLYRQRQFGDWNPVLEEVMRDQAALAAQRRQDDAQAISAARHSGHRQRPPGSSRPTGNAGIDLHQQSNGCPCIAQSNTLRQRGQRALFAGTCSADGFITIQNELPDIRSGNDATSGKPPESPASSQPPHPAQIARK